MAGMSRIEGARRILLVDCDAFFVQVARLEDPEGAGRAPYLIVGGRPESRGVVSSASYEARRFGVRSAMPTAQAVRLCPDALVVPVPRDACQRRSRDVRRVLEGFTPLVDAASIDEFYLDLTGTEVLYGGEPLEETAERIRRAVREEAGIDVSIGGGAYRTVAKLAVESAKPAGVRIIPPGKEGEFMRGFELSAIPGVGPVLAERLRGLGMRSVEDALHYDEALLRGMIGEATGSMLYRRIRGLDPVPTSTRAPSRSVSREETFASDLYDDADLRRELLRLVVRAAAEIRKEGVRARRVTVKVRDEDFRTRQASTTLREGISADRAVDQVAVELLDRLRSARRTGVRLLGVSLSEFEPAERGAEGVQLGLFEDDETGEDQKIESPRDRSLARAVDDLRERFGPRAVVPGGIVEE